MKKQSVKTIYKKLLCFATVLAMMAVVLFPSVKVKAAERLYISGYGYVTGPINSYGISYNPSEKKLVLRGYLANFSNDSYFLRSYVSGLTICLEGPNIIMGGGLLLNGDTTITGPGALEIYSGSATGIYVTGGSSLVIDNANIEVVAGQNPYVRNSRKNTWAICGDETGEQLYVRNSIVHAEANYAAISDFGYVNLNGCAVVSPKTAYLKYGNVYQSEGGALAKKVDISDLYIVRQPASEVIGAVGDYVTLKVTTGVSANYQWQRYNREKSKWENVSFNGAQSNALRFQVSEDMYSWRFRCVITKGLEKLITDDINFKVVAKITNQPATSVYVNSGSNVTLSVTAEGTIMNYVWQYYNQRTGKWINLTEGGNFSNVRTRSMTVKGNDSTQGMYFRCAVTNKFGYTVYTDGTILRVR